MAICFCHDWSLADTLVALAWVNANSRCSQCSGDLMHGGPEGICTRAVSRGIEMLCRADGRQCQHSQSARRKNGRADGVGECTVVIKRSGAPRRDMRSSYGFKYACERFRGEEIGRAHV